MLFGQDDLPAGPDGVPTGFEFEVIDLASNLLRLSSADRGACQSWRLAGPPTICKSSSGGGLARYDAGLLWWREVAITLHGLIQVATVISSPKLATGFGRGLACIISS
jgi:hypothetical protein